MAFTTTNQLFIDCIDAFYSGRDSAAARGIGNIQYSENKTQQSATITITFPTETTIDTTEGVVEVKAAEFIIPAV